MNNQEHVLKISKFEYPDLFGLDSIHNLILKVVGLADMPPNLKKIIKYVGNSEEGKSTSKTSVRRRIFGSSESIGLESTGFVIAVKKPHGYRNEKQFILSSKGLVTEISQGIKINKINIFALYVKLLLKIFQDKKLLQFSEEFIVNQIQFFIVWHKIMGTSFADMPFFNDYYEKFFQNGWDYKTRELIFDKLKSDEIKVIENYAIASKIFETLKNERKFPIIKITAGHVTSDYRPLRELEALIPFPTADLIFKWYRFIGNPQLFNQQAKLDESVIRESVDRPHEKTEDIVENIEDNAIWKSKRIINNLKKASK